MLWFHPLLQALATLLALYVGLLGLIRFRANHLGRKAVFPWKRHVKLGIAVYALWTLGLIGGFIVTASSQAGIFAFEDHAETGLVMLGWMAAGLATGLFMDRSKAKRTYLPLAHGIINLVLLYLAVEQAITGIRIIRYWVLKQ